jgi:uridylate kinase
MYKRIVLKLSGEVLAGPRGFGLDADKVAEITGEIVDVHSLGVEIGVVVGGGNFFRGACSPPSSTPSPCRTPLKSAACNAA